MAHSTPAPVCSARSRAALAARVGAVALVVATLAAHAGEPAPCAPRTGEKLGVRFVEVCASHTVRFADASAHPATELPPFWLAATPLPCSAGEHETLPCDMATALEASPGDGVNKNAAVGAVLLDASVAHRTCALRFGGRLPTPLEREQARRVLGVASLLVREVPGDAARLRVDDLPEWVAEGDCQASPSKPGPGCRITRFPPLEVEARSEAEKVLACRAEVAAPDAQETPTGSECAAQTSGAGELRSDCGVRVADAGPAFALRCRGQETSGPSARATSEVAAVRCVLPEYALGRVDAPGRE